jgi:hypothetical protein
LPRHGREVNAAFANQRERFKAAYAAVKEEFRRPFSSQSGEKVAEGRMRGGADI